MEKYEIFENQFLCCATYLNPEYREMQHCSIIEQLNVRKVAKDYTLEYIKTIVPSESNQNSTQSESDDSDDSFTKKSRKSSTKKNITEKDYLKIVQKVFEQYSAICKNSSNVPSYQLPIRESILSRK